MNAAETFEGERPRLTRLAYRMLASREEAEDVVQDAWLRWSGAEREAVREPAAWLTRVVTRLCLDRLRSARARLETYVGPWLPEPWIEPPADDPVERAEDVSVAFLLAMQRLSPIERAAFLLHDVFDDDYPAIAKALGRDEAACRKALSRARAHLKAAKPRYAVASAEAERLVGAFLAAAREGDSRGMAAVLAEDCVFTSDGGGRRSAALRPMVGRAEVIRLIEGLAWRGKTIASVALEPVRVNGAVGFIARGAEGVETLAFEVEAGAIAAIYNVRNPEKLRLLSEQS